MNLTYSQTKLKRIDDSNYFTDQENVFFVFSNILNNSGFLGNVFQGIDTLQVSNLTDSKTKIVSKESFLNTYELGKQYHTHLTVAVRLPKIDIKKFKIFDKNYIWSNNYIFYKIHTIKNVDSSSFTVINDNLSKDKNYVFFENKVIKKANPKTFEIIEYGFYTKDDKHVYNRGEIIKNADPISFKILNYTYQKDKNNVWVIGKRTNIDVNTFKTLKYKLVQPPNKQYNSLYVVDKNYVYFQGKIMPQADPNSFSLIVSEAPYQVYGIDTNNVFYSGKKIDSADSKSFTIIKNKTSRIRYNAQDKNYYYNRDIKIKK